MALGVDTRGKLGASPAHRKPRLSRAKTFHNLPPMNNPSPVRRKLRPPNWLLLVLLVPLVAGCASRSVPEPAAPATFRVMTFNIHHGEGLDRRVDWERIAAVIRAEGADLVALQEVDRGTARTARRDLTAELAALTGMTGIFSNNFAFQGGEYGNAILSRFPVRHWTNLHYRMLRPGEQRGLLLAEVEVRGRPLRFLNTHIDYRPDDTERLANVEEIAAAVAAWVGQGSAVIVAGDFNDVPGSRVWRRLGEQFHDAWELVGTGDGFTFPADAPRRRIDYVWFAPTNGLRPLRAWVPETQASDHRPVVVEFAWP